MAWISVYEQLKDHHKLRDLAKLLKSSRHEALGILVMLWLWGVNNADRSGDLNGADMNDIADGVLYRGDSQLLINSLITSGWIDYNNGQYSLHDWDIWQEQWFKALDRRDQSKVLMRKIRSERKDGNVSKQLIDCEHNVSTSPSPNLTVTLPNLTTKKDINNLKGCMSAETSDNPKKPEIPYRDIIDFYNKHRRVMAEAKTLSDGRKKFINARFEKYGIETIKEVILKAGASDFMNGGGSKGWIASGFDWLMRPENFPHILEGKYDNKTGKNKDDWRDFDVK